jgi:hypothetical protein
MHTHTVIISELKIGITHQQDTSSFYLSVHGKGP